MQTPAAGKRFAYQCFLPYVKTEGSHLHSSHHVKNEDATPLVFIIWQHVVRKMLLRAYKS